MPGLLVVGGLSLDHLVYEGREAQFFLLGGPALYGALGARAAGAQVAVATVLPDDEPRFAEVFSRCDIDTSRCRHTPLVARVWILHGQGARKLLPVGSHGGTELHDADFEEDLCLGSLLRGDETGTVLLSSPEPGIKLPGATVLIDPHQDHVQAMGVEYYQSFSARRLIFLPSRLQLSLLGGGVDDGIRTIRETTGADVIARLDSEGMRAVGDGVDARCQDTDVPVVDTTGAGDSSAGAIAAAIDAGASLTEAMQVGVTVVRHTLAGWASEALVAYIERC